MTPAQGDSRTCSTGESSVARALGRRGLLLPQRYQDLELATLEWVDWYNHRRLFSAIGYVPPAEYEASNSREQVLAEAGTQ